MRLERFLTEAVIKPNIKFVSLIMGQLRPKLLMKNMPASEVARILNTEFNKHFVFFEVDDYQNQDEVAGNLGLTSAAFSERDQCIIVGINDNIHNAILNSKNYDQFTRYVETYVEHEIIHVIQSMKIPDSNRAIATMKYNKDSSTERGYLSNEHELMAFANSALKELTLIGGLSQREVMDLIRAPRKNPNVTKSTSLMTYLYMFKDGEEPLKKFLKYLYDYAKD